MTKYIDLLGKKYNKKVRLHEYSECFELQSLLKNITLTLYFQQIKMLVHIVCQKNLKLI